MCRIRLRVRAWPRIHVLADALPFPASGNRDVYLRVVKIGNDFTAYYKNSIDDEWILIGTTEGFESLTIQVGLFGGVDQGDGNFQIQYDFFHK